MACFHIIGSAWPVEHQTGWRHFEIERRLLEIGGVPLKKRVMARRRSGMKTEPAFAAVLRLAGDPYEALRRVASPPAAELATRVADALNGSDEPAKNG